MSSCASACSDVARSRRSGNSSALLSHPQSVEPRRSRRAKLSFGLHTVVREIVLVFVEARGSEQKAPPRDNSLAARIAHDNLLQNILLCHAITTYIPEEIA